MTQTIARFPQSVPSRPARAGRYRLEHVSDDALHAEVKSLAGRYNGLTADLLAHLAEVDARGIYRERACSSLYTYCVYELRLSEDEAQRRASAARTARAFPLLFEMLAEGAIHLTGLLLLAPHLTLENHAALLARARFRTKREIERLVAEIAPRPDVPARIEPLGPRPAIAGSLWQAFTASLRGPERELMRGVEAGQAPPAALDGLRVELRDAGDPAERSSSNSAAGADSCEDARDAVVAGASAPARVDGAENDEAAPDGVGVVESEGSVEGTGEGSAPARVRSRNVPAEIRREVWRRAGGRCTFADASREFGVSHAESIGWLFPRLLRQRGYPRQAHSIVAGSV